ncbi:MAG: TIGR00366 family protein [Woeseia sp.]
MLNTVTRFLVRLADRWMPDPLVIAIFLTYVCIAAALLFTDFGLADTVDAWGVSYWNLLAFTMQMVLILGLGHIVAHTRPVHRALVFIADRVRSAPMAYGGLALLAGICGLFSWGVALILPAVMSRIIGESCERRGIDVHFPLLVASGWLGASTSMQGLSASIPLTINTPGHFLENELGLIGLSATVLSAWSLIIVFTKLSVITAVVSKLGPAPAEIRKMPTMPMTEGHHDTSRTKGPPSPSDRAENSRLVTLSLALLGAIYIVLHFRNGGGLNLNTMNMIFLTLGLGLADSPRHYLALLGNAGRVVAPFFIQYPLYAGIMGIIAVSGLGALFVSGFVAISNAETLPIWTFLSAGFLNMFIPSAGGQWAVQGPIAVEAAMHLGTDMPRIVMAVTLGESWTNAIQPLYAIPVLAVAGLHIRDVMGYGVLICAVNGAIYLTALVFF